MNRVRLTELISLLQNVTFPVLAAFLLSRVWGIDGVWLSFLTGELLTMAVVCALVWTKNKRVALSAEAFALLPKGFGVGEADRIEMNVRSREEAMQASVEAQAFCRAHGENERNSALISLCVEEMVRNIVEHGFKKERRGQSVDVRLLFKDGQRVLRIRDNCVNFDPVAYLKLHETDDPTAHIGIRMVMKMVKSANYVNSLGLNNLTLVL